MNQIRKVSWGAPVDDLLRFIRFKDVHQFSRNPYRTAVAFVGIPLQKMMGVAKLTAPQPSLQVVESTRRDFKALSDALVGKGPVMVEMEIIFGVIARLS